MVSLPQNPPDSEQSSVAPDVPREERLQSVAEQVAAIDLLIGLAREHIQVFDVDLSWGGWNTAARADALAQFMRAHRNARLDIIVHETRWIETSCPRLVTLLRRFGHVMTIYKTGSDARAAMDPLMIVDARHHLHRYHVQQPRATLIVGMTQATRPLLTRFEEIWATGEPGLTGTVLGI